MKNVTIVLKVSNITINIAEKTKIEIKMIKLNIEKMKLEIEKKKIIIEKIILKTETIKFTMQWEILKIINNYIKK